MNLCLEPVVLNPKLLGSTLTVWSCCSYPEGVESIVMIEYVVQHSKRTEKTLGWVGWLETCSLIVGCFKLNKRDWNGLMSKKLGLGYGFTRKACFVCGSFGHLIRDCDFHEKRMAKQVELNKKKSKGTGQGQNRPFMPVSNLVLAGKANVVRPIMNGVRPRPVWNNVQRLNHQNKFVPTAVLIRTGRFLVNTAGDKAVSAVGGIRETVVKTSADPRQRWLGHMTGNKAYLVDYQEFKGGSVVFGGSKGKITGKEKIKTRKLNIDDVYFVKELQDFNLFSVSQMCDKKNKVLFTDTECLVLSPDFKLPDDNQVLLRIPRQNNMYSFNLENIIPTGGLACLIAKATVDESNKWHRRLGHVNFKNLNKLFKGYLVRDLPSKIFQNDHTCVACYKGKQHKASWKGPTWLFNLDYLTDSINYQPVTAENKANKTTSPKEANNSAEAKNGGKKPNGDIGSKTNEEPVDQAHQIFLKEYERLKRQEKEANDVAETLRKEFAQDTEDLLLQAEAARASSTNYVNTASTPVNTASPSRNV
ncbi:ribonuclease H-like domain-containing protein, partial [Tanacetum coccineum]